MRVLLATLVATTAVFSTVALAAPPTIPNSVLNPSAVPNQALSVDQRATDDQRMTNDAATLAGVEQAESGISPSQAKVNSDHDMVDRLQQQYDHDNSLRAPHATLKNDKNALKDAQNQLKNDQKTCLADIKSGATQLSPQLRATACK